MTTHRQDYRIFEPYVIGSHKLQSNLRFFGKKKALCLVTMSIFGTSVSGATRIADLIRGIRFHRRVSTRDVNREAGPECMCVKYPSRPSYSISTNRIPSAMLLSHLVAITVLTQRKKLLIIDCWPAVITGVSQLVHVPPIIDRLEQTRGDNYVCIRVRNCF